MPRTLDVRAFAQRCRELMDTLDPEGVVVTRRGRPIARLIPIREGCADLIGSMRGRIRMARSIQATRLVWKASGTSRRRHKSRIVPLAR
jgi:antitoxin (DNA-binding transcriptional repressor) of toxin-antitoxin stability system